MPQQPEIIISINPDGSFETEVKGVEGKSCTDLTTPLERELGVVETRQFKPEYRKNNVTAQRLHQRS